MEELRSILLAEDNPNDVELTLSGLAQLHLANEVVVVRDGAEALDYLYSRGKYVDGLQVLHEIKSNEKLKSIPVVMLTSSAQESDLVKSYQLGVNAYVVKPVSHREFVNAVRQVGAFWAVVNEPPPENIHRAS